LPKAMIQRDKKRGNGGKESCKKCPLIRKKEGIFLEFTGGRKGQKFFMVVGEKGAAFRPKVTAQRGGKR